MAAGVVCELGWSVVGPQTVARMSLDRQSEYFVASIATKLMSLSVGIPVAAIIASLVAPNFKGVAALVAASMSLAALSPGWFLTGRNRPGLILASDSGPRLLFTLVAAGLIFAGGPLEVAAIPGMLTPLIALAMVRLLVKVRVVPRTADFRRGLTILREHSNLTFGRLVSVTYTSLLTTFVGIAMPSAVVLYAATDRLLRMGLNVLSGFPSRLQSWVGMADGDARTNRSRKSLLANVLLGLIAAPAFYLVAPLFSSVLFVGEIDVTSTAALIGAGTAFMVCTSRGLGLSLVAEGKANTIAVANIAAAVAGVVAVFTLTPVLGSAGALLSALTAETIGVLVQLVLLMNRSLGRKRL